MGFGSFTSEDAEVVFRLRLYYVFCVRPPIQQEEISGKSTIISHLISHSTSIILSARYSRTL